VTVHAIDSDARIQNVRAAIRAIEGGFLWALTPQGREWWEGVVDNLYADLERISAERSGERAEGSPVS
jgi:hypothetical protein